MQYNVQKVMHDLRFCLLIAFMLGLAFDHEDGGNILLRNFG
jgi:hypothetical protein